MSGWFPATRSSLDPVPVSRPTDASEHEAERAADAVAGGGSVSGWSFSAAPVSPGEVQRSPGSAAAASAVLGDGLAGPGRPLDAETRGAMGARFGYDFSSVRVHDDGRAAAAASRLGAEAFTIGDRVAFANRRFDPASPAGGRLLAHELAHVVQQGRNPAASGVVHRYTAYTPVHQSAGLSLGWVHPGGRPIRIADDGQMAVEDNGWGAGLNKRAWTTPQLVASANATLTAQGSRASLRAKPGSPSVSGTAPETGDSATLVEIEPYNPLGGTFNLASDCGHACRQVMGSGSGSDVAALSRPTTPGSSGQTGGVLGAILGALAVGAGGAALGSLGGPIGAVIGGLAGAIAGGIAGYYAGREIARSDPTPGTESYLTPRGYYGGDNAPGGSTHTAEDWTEELLHRELGGATRAEAYQRYAALSLADREAFDRKHGINRFARPRVGQGMTISTEYDMPGFSSSGFTWNFHYAATVLTSGDDFVTLESAAGWAPTDWIFYMYGPAAKAQSFYEEQGATNTHGTRYSTFVVQPERLLDLTTTRETSLRTGGTTVTLAAGTPLRVIERRPGPGGRNVSYLVRVTAGPHSGTTGTVSAGDVR